MAAPPLSPPVLLAKLGALLTKARDDVSEWAHAGPRPGQQHPCELAVGDLSSEDRYVLMRALVADGFTVQEVAMADADHTRVFRVERAHEPPPATPAAKLAAMKTLFDEWMAEEPLVGKPFLRELAVGDLTDSKRAALASALTAAGFHVSDVEYDDSPPCRVFHVKREAVGTRPPPASNGNNERVLAIVADVNRQYTNWLVLVQCDLLDYSVWDADVTGLSEPERALLCRLLECHGFRVTRGAGASVDTFFLHRHPADDYGSDEEEEDATGMPGWEMGEMEEVEASVVD